jgi:hypothetical protein
MQGQNEMTAALRKMEALPPEYPHPMQRTHPVQYRHGTGES